MIHPIFSSRSTKPVARTGMARLVPMRFGSGLSDLPADILQILDKPPLPTEVPPLQPDDRDALLQTLQAQRQKAYLPEKNDPPVRPVGLPDTRLVELPPGYVPEGVSHTKHSRKVKLPTQSDIGKIGWFHPLNYTLPPLNGRKLAIPANPKAHMDIEKDKLAQRLVAGGWQPSIIGCNWKAVWSMEKVCRDILQNFYDGHGGTLEGVRFTVSKSPWSKNYRVRIEGQAQYDYEKAFFLGGTSKPGDKKAAGNNGEGLQVLSLNLLRDYGAKKVTMASANWQMTYRLPNTSDRLDRHLKRLSRPFSGNFLEFTTDRTDLIAQLFKAIQHFKHPYNPDFQNITCQTSYGGFKLLPEKCMGNLYLAGQRFAYVEENKWEASVPGMTIWTNEKDVDSLDKGRDRSAVTSTELEQMTRKIIGSLSDTDLVYTLHQLESHWETGEKTIPPPVLDYLITEIKQRKLSCRFDDKYYAGSLHKTSFDVLDLLNQFGYKVCHKQFEEIGMTPLTDWNKYFCHFKAVEPTEEEKLRLSALNHAMSVFIAESETMGLSPLLQPSDVAKPIYIYNRQNSQGPDRVEGLAKGNTIWFGRDVLALPLPVAFNYYAHELMHKVGPDDSEAFSLAYDAYIPQFMQVLSQSPKMIQTFRNLEEIWKASIERDGAHYLGGFYKGEAPPEESAVYAQLVTKLNHFANKPKNAEAKNKLADSLANADFKELKKEYFQKSELEDDIPYNMDQFENRIPNINDWEETL